MDQEQMSVLRTLSTNQLINYIRDRGYAVAMIDLSEYPDTVNQESLEDIMVLRGYLYLDEYA